MFRDLLDEDGHILTHNFRPIQPLGDRIVQFNIIDNDDNTLNHDHQREDDDLPDEIPVEVESGNNDDLTNDDKNVLNDSPDNNLDDEKVDDSKPGKKAKLESGSTIHFISLYVLSIGILTIILSEKRMC